MLNLKKCICFVSSLFWIFYEWISYASHNKNVCLEIHIKILALIKNDV